MSEIDTGGYAFPFSPTGSDEEQNGLTLLDYFAAKAMNSLLANHQYSQAVSDEKIAFWSYGLAQAMLAEKQRIEGGL